MDINKKVKSMTLEEKIGQKLMLDFRHWDIEGNTPKDMTLPQEAIKEIIINNHIGGIILFSNNLKEEQQIKDLTAWYAAMRICNNVRLLIATDNEGGSVFRLPRGTYRSFPGNMALAAAIQGGLDPVFAYAQGQQIARDMLSMNINTNFAPVADVNSNPLNPVINVRGFSDCEKTVSLLSQQVAAGMHHSNMITCYKHFPGHGNTAADSHMLLPQVHHSIKDAFEIDIAPYHDAIEKNIVPDMIMTAHIQYPALDDNVVKSLTNENIIVPATMSRKIQTDILRGTLKFKGVSISDALDMGAIAGHFSKHDALMNVFSAGVDIALMPISISSASQIESLTSLVAFVSEKIKSGALSEQEINISVARILRLKQKYSLLDSDLRQYRGRYFKATHQCGTPINSRSCSTLEFKDVEETISNHSITAVINQKATLPLKNKDLRYFILTPWREQADGIKYTMNKEGYEHVIAAAPSTHSGDDIKHAIDQCDVFMLGTMSTSFTPAEQESPSPTTPSKVTADIEWLEYANALGKKKIHLSLRAPYDIVSYARYADAAVASYSFYGYNNGIWRGPSMISLAEVLIGKRSPEGKLPVTIWHTYNAEHNSGLMAFPRGFGLRW